MTLQKNAELLAVLTVKQIASEIGCCLQTVRKRIKTASTPIPEFQIGKSTVYMRSHLEKIKECICDTGPSRGRSSASKRELRERHYEAFRLRNDDKMSYKKIATTLGYTSESGAWRAIKIEAARRTRKDITPFGKSF